MVSGSVKCTTPSNPGKMTTHQSNVIPSRKANGDILFSDHPEFVPNLTPKEIFHFGSFGGTYFRPIFSCVTGEQYTDVWNEFPRHWFPRDLKKYVVSPVCDKQINKYKVTSGTSLRYWEEKGWIDPQSPYGWVQWYMRFYAGQRSHDDDRQIDRFNRAAGPRGRWRSNLRNKIHKKAALVAKSPKQLVDDYSISPVVRQLLQQWAFVIQQRHL